VRVLRWSSFGALTRAAAVGRGQALPAGDESPHVELSNAPGQLRSAAEEAAQAWGDNSSLSLRYTMPWGEEYTGATLVDMYLAELAAHAWDLARATGQLDKLDPSLALPALEGARAMIKPQNTTRVPSDAVLAVVEIVSPSTVSIDRAVKPAMYAEAGIPVYWRVELHQTPKIVACTLRQRNYVTHTTLTAGTTGRITRPFPVVLDPAHLTRRAS
jgi:hypothetical protein